MITTYDRDMNISSVSGTAAHPMAYAYNVSGNEFYAQTTKLTSTGGTLESTKDYTDFLGRQYKTVYAAPSTSPTLIRYFNNLGQMTNQIDPDTNSTIYVFNAKGETTHTIMDMNQNGAIDWNGPDRITFVTNDVVIDSGANMRRSRTYVWATNANTSVLISTAETSVDGLTNLQTVWNNGAAITSTNITVIIAVTGYQIVTSFAPDRSSLYDRYKPI